MVVADHRLAGCDCVTHSESQDRPGDTVTELCLCRVTDNKTSAKVVSPRPAACHRWLGECQAIVSHQRPTVDKRRGQADVSA